jgi:hypothetical protein
MARAPFRARAIIGCWLINSAGLPLESEMGIEVIRNRCSARRCRLFEQIVFFEKLSRGISAFTGISQLIML